MKAAIIFITTAALGGLFALSEPGGAQAATVRAHWGFNEIASFTAEDDSGNDNTGDNQNVVGDGQGYMFNGSDSRVVVPNSDSLNPGSSDFSFGVTLVTTTPAAGADYDLLRKGVGSTAGGWYKLEIVPRNGSAKAVCAVRDSAAHSTSLIWAPRGGLNDGKQHTITCSRTGNTLNLQIDGYPLRSKTNTTYGIGAISNTAQLSMGAKSDVTDASGDWFLGEIYDAFVS